MLPSTYDMQEPMTSGPSCSASDILTGFTMEDAFCPTQSLQSRLPGPQQPPSPRPPQEFVAAAEAGATRGVNARGAHHFDTPAHTPESSQQARVCYLMEQAAAAGFETLDEAVAAYYTETFEDVPALYQEQRLSRNRRLPRLLNTLQSAARGWSEWERRGFQEQMTMGAEELLVQELNAFVRRQQRPGGISSGGDGVRSADNDDAAKGGHFGTPDKPPMMRVTQAQNDFPNLWALMTALLARANPSRQVSGSDTVLAIIETLCHGRDVGSASGGGLDRS
ncbi:hypothetical protein LX36DRAFT_87248 [Colletotrichum falcatum]|nr:hypothetical protein LX36DRAFT_87248 [Colletotrichum falcatum]